MNIQKPKESVILPLILHLNSMIGFSRYIIAKAKIIQRIFQLNNNNNNMKHKNQLSYTQIYQLIQMTVYLSFPKVYTRKKNRSKQCNVSTQQPFTKYSNEAKRTLSSTNLYFLNNHLTNSTNRVSAKEYLLYVQKHTFLLKIIFMLILIIVLLVAKYQLQRYGCKQMTFLSFHPLCLN